MKNKEYLVALLTDNDSVDDDGASYEAMVYYNIACPYFLGDKRALCYGTECEDVDRSMCFKCKENWLNSEVNE